TNPRHAVQRVEERAPAPTLGVEHFLARSREMVETPPAAAAALHPLARDQAAAFEAVERRIERGHVERDGAVRPRVDQLGDLVAVAIAFFEQREDEHLGAALPQIAVRHMDGLYVCPIHMSIAGYFMEGWASRLRPQATVVPAPLSSAVAIVCPRDPKTETWGLREN